MGDELVVNGKEVIAKFMRRHSDCRKELQAWVGVCENARWNSFLEVQSVYSDADQVGDCSVFNIRRNRYRLVAKINFRGQIVAVRDVMTHVEYDRGVWKNGCNCK
jgi:mRNA interferase HigB